MKGGAPAPLGRRIPNRMDIADPTLRLDPALLATPIRGRNLGASTLGAELGSGAVALVFLRHYG